MISRLAGLHSSCSEEAAQIVTLPPSIGKLRSVKHLVLYGSYLVRVPSEIGKLTSLVEFSPYTSWRLHWLPYEITRCPKLIQSTISTRCLYGNFKHRPPFPKLPAEGTDFAAITDANLHPNRGSINCSVCDNPCHASSLNQVWISLLIATDVVPLLVNACSRDCIDALPTPSRDHVRSAHSGGLSLNQPAAGWH